MRSTALWLTMGLLVFGCAEERGFTEDSSEPDVSSEVDIETTESSDEGDTNDEETTPLESCTDEDGDSYGDGCTAGADCDDTNGEIFEERVAFVDNDGDGYSIGQEQVVCSGNDLPVGFVEQSEGEDCDDTSNTVWREVALYLDEDSDGYSVAENLVCIGEEVPAGTSQTSLGEDCDDADPEGHQILSLFVDMDGDGFTVGESQNRCVGDEAPAGFVEFSLGEDCDDSTSDNFVVWVVFTDEDGDGFGSGDAFEVCFGSSPPEGTITASQGQDCDDSDADEQVEVAAFIDNDGDGFGSGEGVQVCSGLDADLPEGFVKTGGDCNDDDASAWTFTTAYVDGDQDGIGALLEENVCSGDSALPLGYSLQGGDCNDADETVYQTLLFYPDLDKDGIGQEDAELEEVCSGLLPPPGFSSIAGDCDDSNPSVTELASVYQDTDGDGFGVGQLLQLCKSPEELAADYAALDGDCAPDDDTAWFLLTLYPDVDNDGFGDESQPNEVCLGADFPAMLVSGEDGFDCDPIDPLHWFDCGVCVDADEDGFGSNCDVAEDCDDLDEGSYPGAEEIPDNGKVENCEDQDLIANSQIAVFVSASAPSGGDGTKFSPLKSLKAGMKQAKTEGKFVAVASGLYEVDELVIEASMHGGYNPLSWERDGTGTSTVAGENGFSVVISQGASVRLSGITFQGAEDFLSYSLTNGGEVRLDDCVFNQASSSSSIVVTGMLNTGKATLRDVSFVGGAAQGTSNGIENKPSGTLFIRDSSIVAPVSNTGTGTGIRNEGHVRLENTQIEVTYTAGNGNGVLNTGGTLLVAGGLIAAANSGGRSIAVKMEGGSLLMAGTLVHGGSGDNGARALVAQNESQGTVLQSILRTGPASDSEAIELTGGELTVVNSILETHEGGGTAVRCTGGDETLNLMNNLLHGGEQSFIAGDYTSEDIGVVTEESIEACGFGCCNEMSGNLIGSPQYLVVGNDDPETWDFHLDVTSPAIGAGIDAFTYLDGEFLLFLGGLIDLDGEAHPGADGLWDIGLDSVQ